MLVDHSNKFSLSYWIHSVSSLILSSVSLVWGYPSVVWMVRQREELARFQSVYTLHDFIHLKRPISDPTVLRYYNDGNIGASRLSLYWCLLNFGFSIVALLWNFSTDLRTSNHSWSGRDYSWFGREETKQVEGVQVNRLTWISSTSTKGLFSSINISLYIISSPCGCNLSRFLKGIRHRTTSSDGIKDGHLTWIESFLLVENNE